MSDHGTVFIVDDDEALRRGLTRLLQSHGLTVQSYASAESYLAAFNPTAPGCLLLDLRMPGQSGLELQRTLAERGVQVPIVFLTGHGDVQTSVHAMKSGAIDFLEKPASETDLVAAVRRGLDSDSRRRSEAAEIHLLRQRYEKLTAREREVLGEMVAGHRNKDAAQALGIAERTVKLHRSRVMEKMEAPSLADLVRIVERLGVREAAG
jgi:FixJ family two-component response regulator